ncbi:GNAT family N-acetyltransferase [Leekyejoonella antrihumi]|uniref:GNAT family N-acetyltransferase n=1 Tax=Leekyejoonella antrihumi TaxID=1660198 RepID=A0A563E2Z2_9MICO|nr:GNAT family N-acetyltransferase [Leekyejoonella antrihumi]
MHVQIWREAYAGLIAPEHLAGLRWQRSAERFRGAAEVGDGEVHRERVAQHVASGALVGIITVGVGRDDDAPTAVELSSLNVLAAHHGTGVATKLVDAALGEQAAYLWVLEGNERAIAFYRKHDFALDGATKWDDRFGVNELRMVRGKPTCSRLLRGS